MKYHNIFFLVNRNTNEFYLFVYSVAKNWCESNLTSKYTFVYSFEMLFDSGRMTK